MENLRNNFLNEDDFDKQENFFAYVQNVIEHVSHFLLQYHSLNLFEKKKIKSIQETDKAFFEEYTEVAMKTGCAALIVLIIGELSKENIKI